MKAYWLSASVLRLRLNFLLVLALIASALLVVHIQYEVRRVFVQLERVQAQGRQLQVEGARLQVERRAQATSLRVDTRARERLGMLVASPSNTQYVNGVGAEMSPQSTKTLP